VVWAWAPMEKIKAAPASKTHRKVLPRKAS